MRSTIKRKSISEPGSPEALVRTRGSHATRVLAGAVLLAILATGCQIPVSKWVPDFNKDGKISENEVKWQTAVVARSIEKAVNDQRRAVQNHRFLTCIRHHESDRGPWPHINGYAAQNSRSTASGAYQFLDSTWRTMSAQAGHPGYARAKYAPWYVQDAVILHVYNHGGRSHWAGSGC